MAVSILDHRGGVLKTFHSDAIDDHDRLVEVTEQDMDPIMARIEYLRHLQECGKADPSMKVAAVIPQIVVEQMMRDGSWNDPAAIKRWANDPGNKAFRVWPGRL